MPLSELHSDWRYARTAQSILTAVLNATAVFRTTKVTTVGHSLGAPSDLL